MFARSVTVTLLIAVSLWSQDMPVLTDSQKLKVREIQLEIANTQIESYRAAEKYKATMEKLANALAVAAKEATPKGYILTPELKLVPEIKDK